MPNCYRLAALVGALALFSAPALADGYADRPVNRGPTPLKAHDPTPPEPGCYLIDAASDTWSCPPLPQKSASTVTTRTVSAPAHQPATYGATTRRYVDESKTRTYVNRYTTGGECCGGTPRPAPPPPPPVVVQKTRIERGMVIDIAGFDGGVGSGIDGGYYGGGGGFAYASASSSASAFSSASAALTFRGGFKGGGKHRGGKKRGGGGCGCK